MFSALALLTHSFAGFLVAPEALWLLYVIRDRAIAVAVGVVAVVQVALLPLLFTHATSSLLGFISGTPLGSRIQQVPVEFGLGTLYQSPIVSYGLLGAAALAGALVVLLVIGADGAQLRGAGAAAALAAVVLLLPLLLALLGEDYYIPRALMPAWIPLAVVVGAACTAPRARVAGAILAAILLASFVYAQVRISDNPQYQRPNWRGVARALGTAGGPRAIVAYDGSAATDPLAIYLPGVPWTAVRQRPRDRRRGRRRRPSVAGARPSAATRREADRQPDRRRLPRRSVLGRAGQAADPGAGRGAGRALLGPPLSGAVVLIQSPSSAR